MALTIQERHLIDRYLQGELSGIELEDFMLKINTNHDFKQAVELDRLIYDGIKMAHHQSLKKIILSTVKYRQPLVPFALKMIVTFLTVTATGITLWFYTATESTNREQAKSWFAFLRGKENGIADKKEAQKLRSEPRAKNFVLPDSIKANSTLERSNNDSITVEASSSQADSSAEQNPEEEIIVKQDQLLISTMIAVENKTPDKNEKQDESLAAEAVQQLNPAANLPEEEKPATSFSVEFWVSPVNYHGYKMSKNKLLLFGIDVPDAVKLYRLDNTLYLNYMNEFYLLNNSSDFVTYQKLRDSEIPLAIK